MLHGVSVVNGSRVFEDRFMSEEPVQSLRAMECDSNSSLQIHVAPDWAVGNELWITRGQERNSEWAKEAADIVLCTLMAS